MTKRSVAAVIILTLLTCGLYGLYWYVVTKSEMAMQGADIPTAWLLIIPIASIYWVWKWSQGVEHVTRGRMSAPVTFLLMLLLNVIGMAIIQDSLNKAIDDHGNLPQARVA